MLRLHVRCRPVPESQATGEIARVYHESRQVLRIHGVDGLFLRLSAYGTFLPAFWDALRVNAGTREFEESADQLRTMAVRAAARMNRPGLSIAGASRQYRLRRALELFHYADAKLLLLASTAALSLDGVEFGRPGEHSTIERGIPVTMAPMEMEEEDLEGRFADIKRVFGTLPCEFRALAMFPDYLEEAWRRLPHPNGRGILVESRRLARDLPHAVTIRHEGGSDVRNAILQYERLLPKLMVIVALLSLDFAGPEELAASPFPPGGGE